jgi:hypothetical protein
MEEIRGHDRYLDPPAIPEYAVCERCGDVHHNDDLQSHDYGWYCADCIEIVKAEGEE